MIRFALLAALLLTPLPCRANDLFDIHAQDCRLVLVPASDEDVEGGGGRYWSYKDGQAEFQDYNPRGFFDGRISVRDGVDGLEIGAWRSSYRDWQMTCFALLQTSEAATARYTIRTPAGMSDLTCEVVEPDLTHLLIRHPEVRVMLDEVCTALDASGWEFDPFAIAQAWPDRWTEPPELGRQVRELLPLASSGAWRQRAEAEARLERLGWNAAIILMRMDRADRSAQENLVMDRLIRRWPVLSDADCRALRGEPEESTARVLPAPEGRFPLVIPLPLIPFPFVP